MSPNELAKRRHAGLPPPCVETAQGAVAMSVQLADGELWVLPWSRFCHARLAGEEMTLAFGEVDIVLRGQNLAAVAKDAVTLSIEALRTLPAQYRPIIPATEAFISEMEVIPSK